MGERINVRVLQNYMPIQIGWHDTLPNTIYYDINGTWTWQVYGEAFEQERRMALSLNGQTYNVLGNMLGTSIIPKGRAFSYVYTTVKRSPKNMGQVALVTSNNLALTMLMTFTKVHPHIQETLYVTHCLDDAIMYLRKISGASSTT